MDSCIYEPALFYKVKIRYIAHCGYCLTKQSRIYIKKEIGELNLDINYTLQQTNAM